MRDLIERLQRTFAITVNEAGEAWALLVAKPEGLSFEIVVPHDVLEWFVTVRNAHSEIWSDWADYYPIAGETTAQLKQDMAADIEWFVTNLMAAPLRYAVPATPEAPRGPWQKIKSFAVQRLRLQPRTILEWQRDGAWQRISMCAT